MLIECGAGRIREDITRLLVDFRRSADGGECTALDIVELIARRMSAMEEYQVCVLGYFVRANLLALCRDAISEREALNRFTEAALAAPLGHFELTEVMDAGLSDTFTPKP